MGSRQDRAGARLSLRAAAKHQSGSAAPGRALTDHWNELEACYSGSERWKVTTWKNPKKSQRFSSALQRGLFTLSWCEKRVLKWQCMSKAFGITYEEGRTEPIFEARYFTAVPARWGNGWRIFLSSMDVSKYISGLWGVDVQGKVIPFLQSDFSVCNHTLI